MDQIPQNILTRYKEHGRHHLPWRLTTDPYAIHVSEVMLQQTQVDRVIPYFHRWMKDFPDYESLAKASKTDLLTHRSGLGFNSRAMRLQACAQEVVARFGGKLPMERSQLLSLPGIGPYTSAAILAFSGNIEVPVIDTNIRRVLLFLYKWDETISMNALEEKAEKLIPSGRSRDWHNALMDYGALELTARKTKIKPISKQSKFEGSDRQVRWWIMKWLTKHHRPLAIIEIVNEFPHKDIAVIVEWLVKEWLIIKKEEHIVLE